MTNNEILKVATMNGIKIDPMMFKDTGTRMEAYRALGYTEKALDGERWSIRRDAKKYFELKDLIKTKGEAQAMIDMWKLEQL